MLFALGSDVSHATVRRVNLCDVTGFFSFSAKGSRDIDYGHDEHYSWIWLGLGVKCSYMAYYSVNAVLRPHFSMIGMSAATRQRRVSANIRIGEQTYRQIQLKTELKRSRHKAVKVSQSAEPN